MDNGFGCFSPSICVVTPPTTDIYTIIVCEDMPGQTDSYQLQIPSPTPAVTPIAGLPASVSGTDATGGGAYYGPASSVNGSPPPPTTWYGQTLPPWVGYSQNWYSVANGLLLPTVTYTISMNIPSGGAAPILSIQNSSGVQVAFSYNPGKVMASILFTPPANDTYTIICAVDQPFIISQFYELTIYPYGALNTATMTMIYPGVDLGGMNVNVTVIVSSVGATPTGSVSLSVDAGPATTIPLNGGQAVFTISPGIGNHTMTAMYLSNAPYLPSSNTVTMYQGIPNVKLAPPTNENRELYTVVVLDVSPEPDTYFIEQSPARCWISRSGTLMG